MHNAGLNILVNAFNMARIMRNWLIKWWSTHPYYIEKMPAWVTVLNLLYSSKPLDSFCTMAVLGVLGVFVDSWHRGTMESSVHRGGCLLCLCMGCCSGFVSYLLGGMHLQKPRWWILQWTLLGWNIYCSLRKKLSRWCSVSASSSKTEQLINDSIQDLR